MHARIFRSFRRMIEFFTRKRMVIAIVLLTLISVVALIVETNLRVHPEMKNVDASQQEHWNQSGGCNKALEMVQECRRCTTLEMKMFDYCRATGYSKVMKCKDSDRKNITLSCPKLTAVEERNFWIFETLTAAVGILAYSVVFAREKRLDRLLMDKVNKQIAAGI